MPVSSENGVERTGISAKTVFIRTNLPSGAFKPGRAGFGINDQTVSLHRQNKPADTKAAKKNKPQEEFYI